MRGRINRHELSWPAQFVAKIMLLLLISSLSRWCLLPHSRQQPPVIATDFGNILQRNKDNGNNNNNTDGYQLIWCCASTAAFKADCCWIVKIAAHAADMESDNLLSLLDGTDNDKQNMTNQLHEKQCGGCLLSSVLALRRAKLTTSPHTLVTSNITALLNTSTAPCMKSSGLCCLKIPYPVLLLHQPQPLADVNASPSSAMEFLLPSFKSSLPIPAIRNRASHRWISLSPHIPVAMASNPCNHAIWHQNTIGKDTETIAEAEALVVSATTRKQRQGHVDTICGCTPSPSAMVLLAFFSFAAFVSASKNTGKTRTKLRERETMDFLYQRRPPIASILLKRFPLVPMLLLSSQIVGTAHASSATEDSYIFGSIDDDVLPPTISSSESTDNNDNNGLFVLCAVDGSIYALDAWSGQFRSSSRTGVPLITRSNSNNPPPDDDSNSHRNDPFASTGMIHPGLDGKLYWQSEDGGNLQALPVSIPSLLDHPVRSCSDSENGDGKTHCGILTAVAHNTMLALDTENGALRWSSSVLGGSGDVVDDDDEAPHTVLLQRKDFAVQHLSSKSGKQIWNVTLGSYHAVDFAPPTNNHGRPDPNNKRIDDDDDLDDDFDHDSPDDSAEDDDDSPGPFLLPMLRFGNGGRELSALDEKQAVLWRIESPHVLTSVFGIQHNRWKAVQVLDEDSVNDMSASSWSYIQEDGTVPFARRLPAHAQTPETDYAELWKQELQQRKAEQQWQVHEFAGDALPHQQKQLPPPFRSQQGECHAGGECPNLGYPQRFQLPPPPRSPLSPSGSSADVSILQSPVEVLIIMGVAIGFLLFLLILFHRAVLKDHHKTLSAEVVMDAADSASSTPAATPLGSPSDSDPITASVSFPGAITRRGRKQHTANGSTEADLPLVHPHTPVKSDPGETSSPPEATKEEQHRPDGVPLVQYSRYTSEFEELEALGRGGFGSVFRSKNRLDGLDYAIKKVSIHSETAHKFEQELSRVLREVKILAVLDHPNIVRYFTAWLETEHELNDDECCDGGNQKRNRSSNRDRDSFTRSFNLHDPSMSHSSFDQSESSSVWNTRGGWSSTNKSNWKEQQEAAAAAAASLGDDCGFIFEESSTHSGRNEDSTASPLKVHRSSSFLQNISESREASPVATGQDEDEAQESGWTSTVTGENKSARPLKHTLYIQMQLCRFDTVADFLVNKDARQEKQVVEPSSAEQEEQVDIALALSLLAQIAKAVQHVHEKGLIHRDLKPSNCFMDTSGVIKVGDFGLSRETSDSQGEAENAVVASLLDVDENDDDHTAGVGTRLYASPEQTEGSSYDASTDVYSLGIILFELVYPMWTGMERNICLSKLRQQRQFPSDWASVVGSRYSSPIKSLLQRMLEPRPSHRPTAAGVVQQIKDLLGELSILSPMKAKRNQNLVLLRIESTHEENALQHAISHIQGSGANILQSGMAQEEGVTVMEFALNCKNESNPSQIVNNLESDPKIARVQQVSTHHHSHSSSPEQQLKKMHSK